MKYFGTTPLPLLKKIDFSEIPEKFGEPAWEHLENRTFES